MRGSICLLRGEEIYSVLCVYNMGCQGRRCGVTLPTRFFRGSGRDFLGFYQTYEMEAIGDGGRSLWRLSVIGGVTAPQPKRFSGYEVNVGLGWVAHRHVTR